MKVLISVFLFLLPFSSLSHAACDRSCPKVRADVLNVHVVPHSHDDVGWLKTVDQYYYGANNSIAIAGVQYIYDSTIEELWKDPRKKFVSVEMEFFWHWWKEQDSKTKHKVTKIVERGQLEFVGGGWCMNDEAASSYEDIIDQMTMGLKFLNTTFGQCGIPTAVWQIDPFGHSREQASLFQQMGFDYLFLGRIDHQDKARRLGKQEMEMLWRASDSLNVTIFTGILYNNYSPPRGFCFDTICGDEPIVDDPDSPMYNIDRKAKDFVAYIVEQSKHYLTNNIILTMGEDFQYSNAHTWFKNLDKLIKYVNREFESRRIHLFYSTPSCYGQAVRDAKPILSVKSDDFFPYSSDPHAYWTGYFTSRSAFKGLVRKASNVLRACKQHEATEPTGKGPSADLFTLQRSMAIAQHHDAITGTAKQHVSDDYVLRLDKGIERCNRVISRSYDRLLSLSSTALPEQQFCPFLNVSQCHVTEGNSAFVVNLYNPLSFPVSHIVRIPVLNDAYIVVDGAQQLVPSQLLPISNAVVHIPGRVSEAKFELVFEATNLPPLGLKSYYVEVQPKHLKSLTSTHKSKVRSYSLPSAENIRVSLDDVLLTFDRVTGNLIEVANERGKNSVKQELLYYRGMSGNNTEFEFRASGAYIFRPNGTSNPVGPVRRIETITGPLIVQVYQHFGRGMSQIFRLYRGETLVEVDWVVGPIDVSDGTGKEIVSRFTAQQINNDGIFFTDSNGREVLQRKLNYQPSFQVNVTEPIAGNYYPVNAFAYVDDVKNDLRMVVLNDRAQGAASLHDGELEFMIHRRLLHDDAFGVGEPLNETAYGSGLVVRGTHWLLLTSKMSADWRQLAQRKAHPPIISFTPTDMSWAQWRKSYRTEASLVSRALPPNVKMLSLEPWDKNRLLLRLEHIYGLGEDPIYSKPVNLSVEDLFLSINVLNVEEMNLSVNREKKSGGLVSRNGFLTLNPMEIKTFLLTIRKRSSKL